MSRIKNKAQIMATQLDRTWKTKVQKKSGRTYYVNTVTKKTSWKNPGDALLILATTTKKKVKRVVKKKRHALPTPEGSSRIWKVKTQKSSGRRYYVNSVTKETTWTNPGDAFLIIASKGAAPMKNVKQHLAQLQPESGGRVWKVKVQKSSGRRYYVNKVTKETTWKNPGDRFLILSAKSAGPSSSSSSSSQRRVWNVKVDKKSGRTYYVNTVTKKTSWKSPGDAFIVQKAASGGVARESAAAVAARKETEAAAAAAAEAAAAEVTAALKAAEAAAVEASAAAAAAEATARRVWIERIQEGSGGKRFYLNVKVRASDLSLSLYFAAICSLLPFPPPYLLPPFSSSLLLLPADVGMDVESPPAPASPRAALPHERKHGGVGERADW